jgi:hypothetical protein
LQATLIFAVCLLFRLPLALGVFPSLRRAQWTEFFYRPVVRRLQVLFHCIGALILCIPVAVCWILMQVLEVAEFDSGDKLPFVKAKFTNDNDPAPFRPFQLAFFATLVLLLVDLGFAFTDGSLKELLAKKSCVHCHGMPFDINKPGDPNNLYAFAARAYVLC